MKNLLHKIISNSYFNRVVATLKLDKYFHRANNYWEKYETDLRKSHQEISGYSHYKDVQETVEETHKIIQNTLKKYCTDNASVLDIGCGPGLYLKDFSEVNIRKVGIDLSAKMLKLAKENNPNTLLINGEFLSYQFNQQFDFIYSVGVLQYIPKREIENFFKKIHLLLKKNGAFLINYPHAISLDDLNFSNINFIQYSPNFLNKIVASYFSIVENKHVIDDRVIGDYDKTPYLPLNPKFNTTFKNSSILIAKKN